MGFKVLSVEFQNPIDGKGLDKQSNGYFWYFSHSESLKFKFMDSKLKGGGSVPIILLLEEYEDYHRQKILILKV